MTKKERPGDTPPSKGERFSFAAITVAAIITACIVGGGMGHLLGDAIETVRDYFGEGTAPKDAPIALSSIERPELILPASKAVLEYAQNQIKPLAATRHAPERPNLAATLVNPDHLADAGVRSAQCNLRWGYISVADAMRTNAERIKVSVNGDVLPVRLGSLSPSVEPAMLTFWQRPYQHGISYVSLHDGKWHLPVTMSDAFDRRLFRSIESQEQILETAANAVVTCASIVWSSALAAAPENVKPALSRILGEDEATVREHTLDDLLYEPYQIPDAGDHNEQTERPSAQVSP